MNAEQNELEQFKAMVRRAQINHTATYYFDNEALITIEPRNNFTPKILFKFDATGRLIFIDTPPKN